MPRIQFVLTHIAGSGCGASFSGPAVGGKSGLAGSFQAVAAGLPDGVSAALFVVGGGQPPTSARSATPSPVPYLRCRLGLLILGLR